MRTHAWASAMGYRAIAPLWVFTHSILDLQISKILPFLVVNTGSILIGPPKNFSADALGLTELLMLKS